MNPSWVLLAVLLPFSLGGACDKPKTLGEVASGYQYIPTDPFPVTTELGQNCNVLDPKPKGGPVEPGVDPRFIPLLSALPDNTVRISLQQIEASGKVTFGASTISAEGSRYRAVVDYINSTTISVPFRITRTPRDDGGTGGSGTEPTYSWTVELQSAESGAGGQGGAGGEGGAGGDPGDLVSIPVYVGVGLRLTADIVTAKAGLNISAMSAAAAEAKVDTLSGTLVVQTLGVNGPRITQAIPFQSELNSTTVQNSILALGVVKALLYEEDTVVHPRIVGFYLPFEGEQELVKQIVTQLLTPGKVVWERPCLFDPPSGSGGSGGASDFHGR